MLNGHSGGLGKSTLAKVLFNRLAGSFSHRALVEIHYGEGPEKIAQHLAAALRSLGACVEEGSPASSISWRLQDFVRDKKVLYVLDNVWAASQLTALLPARWGEGSAVIVTSRSKSFEDSTRWRAVRAVCLHILFSPGILNYHPWLQTQII
jgi:hypothetical protein